MACTYLGFRGWENGSRIAPDSDITQGGVDDVFAYAAGVAHHTGNYSLHIRNITTIRYWVTGTPANLGVSFWIRQVYDYGFRVELTLSTGESLWYVYDSAGSTYDAYVDEVKVADGNAIVFEPNAEYYHLDIYTVVDNAGSMGCKINGQVAINYNGDTLPDGASAEIVDFRLAKTDGGSDVFYFRIDDLAWGTGDYPGDVRVEAIVPTADTAVDDWTPTAGDSYACVDEIPPNTSDYIYTNTNTDETELDLGDFDGADKTILAVQVIMHANEDTADANEIKEGVDSNGTDDTTQHIMSTVWTNYVHFMLNNPDDDAAWEDGDIDALKVRVEAVI